MAAFVDDWSGPGVVRVVRRDQETIVLALGPTEAFAPGAAAFAPDDSWLAIVDGAGTLWRVDPLDGSATELRTDVEGFVFGRWLRFGDAEHLVVNLVGSASVPLPSVVATLDIGEGTVEAVTTGGMERGGWPQADGSLLYAEILPSGGATRLMRLSTPDEVDPVAELGITTWLDVGVNGAAVYSDTGGDVLLTLAAGGTRVLARGSTPRFSPDANRVAVVTESNTVRSLNLNGEVLDEVPGPFAAWVKCADRCAP